MWLLRDLSGFLQTSGDVFDLGKPVYGKLAVLWYN
jgi:hypothetical protein